MLALFYIYIYINKTRLSSNEIHREVGRAKDFSASPYVYIYEHKKYIYFV